MAVFSASFFAEVLKTDNMNSEDLQQQITTHTFSKSTGVSPTLSLSLSLSLYSKAKLKIWY
jgi:hypothetical protein